MKIIYVARFGPHDNCDEDAIAFVLEELGHQVIRIEERQGQRATEIGADLLLFHKWDDTNLLRACCKRMPCVSWFFDLVTSDDPLLIARSKHRVAWAEKIEPMCRLGFFTDGDWVALNPEKRVHLMQGADERVEGFGTHFSPPMPPILFAGMIDHGSKRLSHIRELEARYGNLFRVLGGGGPQSRRHGRALANIFASTKIVIAPDGPNTDRYWSNRVYLTTSLGGFLLHPYCKGLREQYAFHELTMYESREHLIDLIDDYLNMPASRLLLQNQGYKATMERHTYRHRVIELLRILKERRIAE